MRWPIKDSAAGEFAWHNKFCWVPTKVGEEMVWLEWVKRRRLIREWEYRILRAGKW